jgi:hypothetical protein
MWSVRGANQRHSGGDDIKAQIVSKISKILIFSKKSKK